MSTGAQPLRHWAQLPHRRVLWLVVGVLAAAGIGVGIDRTLFAGGPGQPSRPALQQTLDRLVQAGVAPGVTAYVAGPQGTWAGSAGVADVTTGAPISPDARMRIESLSKTWLTAVILQLAQEGKLSLDDTVQRWLPGLLRGYGSRITIRELVTDSSGLIDDNDVWNATPAQAQAMLARVGDAKLRAQLVAAVTRYSANPAASFPATLWIRLAAWQPLVAPPGTTYHHSNIGWNVAGLIAAKAGGKPLPVLYRDRIFGPLGLHDTAFSPQGPIAGQHANGYTTVNGRLVDRTAVHPGKFADGAIVTDARDEATFLRAAMNGTLFDKARWL
ncbi:MAG TPA: serine hydrolase domain-containing protein, partial [Solirubrobacteraceae bacterium]|nr:serine hydrolase domain-containing protein [Solirubrobacteraceae bacterium]